MFNSLQDKLDGALKLIRGKTKLTEKDINTALKAVRMALLEADVNFKVAKDFCKKVADKSLGEGVLKSLTPDQQVIKIVHQELVEVMGGEASELNLNVAPPAVIMLVGLQGAGKTTTSGKLARVLKEDKKKKVLLVPADVYRPAAITQLKTLGKQIDVEVYDTNPNENPVNIATSAKEFASLRGFDVVIIDTAGRLQIDTDLMDELKNIEAETSPSEILLVADAMTGQEAVNVAETFSTTLNINGLILTKLDGDARGGAALSMRAVTGTPIKYMGVGEKLDKLEVFHPERMASRILGMGDVLSLIEKASAEIDIEESEKLQKKFKKNEFDLDDFLGQLRMMKKMGGMQSIMGMIPGMGKMMKQVDTDQAEDSMKNIEAIILSMTKKERAKPGIINGSRRKRIASGSGTSVQEVNKLLKQFMEMKKMMKKLTKGGMGNMMKMLGGKGGLPGMEKLLK